MTTTPAPTPDETTAAADRIEAYLAGWNEYLGHWAATSEFIAGGPSHDAPDLMRPDLLVVLAAARAMAKTERAAACPVTAPPVSGNEPALTCVLPPEPAHDWHRAPSGAKWSPNAQAAMAAPARADHPSTFRRCGRCDQPFDDADSTFDGAAEDRSIPGYCRACVDNCHEAGAGHRCPICTKPQPAPATGSPRHAGQKPGAV